MTRTPLRLAVLGDSLAFGTGAGRPADALGPRLTRALSAAGFDVDLHVLAVPGAVSAGLAAQVRRTTPLLPDLAVVVVGANDLARFVPAEQATAALADAVGALRAAGTAVVVVPAPDMSMVPFVPPALRPLVQGACAVLQRRQAQVAAAAGASVAPVAGEVARAFVADPALFSADRFHPSSAGYARIAEVLEPYVLTAARARRDAAAA
ncbi:SGNH/GDSL hydrolase family protein [Blastococcus saxobsidens]|uniref:SGNH/GDSL hydrolase family protein n=1 Tax=Blastococcus saxobsidens TaxID=138336 RepID=A0A6L9W0P4_9ACTN|nr:SGNH/GDSL hydrolase family protein [Blastococcus saxobsidens]